MLGAYKANEQWNIRRNTQLEDKILPLIYFFYDLYIFLKARLSVCPPPKKKQKKISPNDLDKHSKHRTKPEIKFKLVLIHKNWLKCCSPCPETIQPALWKAVFSESVYIIAAKEWKSLTRYFGQEMLHTKQTRLLRTREKMEAENGVGAGRERLSPLLPWRGVLGHYLPGEQLHTGPLRCTHAGNSWSVHLLWHFRLPRARCQSGPHHRPLAREYVYEECKGVSTCRRNFCLCSSFFSVLESKKQACTQVFSTL